MGGAGGPAGHRIFIERLDRRRIGVLTGVDPAYRALALGMVAFILESLPFAGPILASMPAILPPALCSSRSAPAACCSAASASFSPRRCRWCCFERLYVDEACTPRSR